MLKNCEKCGGNCFDPVKGDCISIGVSNATLGIVAGKDSLDSTITKVGEYLSKSTESESNSKSNSGVGIINVCKSESIYATPFTVKITPGEVSTLVEYNLVDVTNQFESTLVDVEVYSYTSSTSGRLYDSNSPTGLVTLPPRNFPITLVITITGIKNNTSQTLKFTKTFNNIAQNNKQYFTQLASEGTNPTTQLEVNEYLNREISKIWTRFNAIDNIDFNGSTGINDILIDLQSQITTEINTQSTTIAALDTKVCELKATVVNQTEVINTQTTQIQNLQSQIDVIKTTLGID